VWADGLHFNFKSIKEEEERILDPSLYLFIMMVHYYSDWMGEVRKNRIRKTRRLSTRMNLQNISEAYSIKIMNYEVS
jgi:hypothetical protein